MRRAVAIPLLLASASFLAAEPELHETTSRTLAEPVLLLVPDGDDVLALTAEKGQTDGAILVSVTEGKIRRRLTHAVASAACDASGKTLVAVTPAGEALVYDLTVEKGPKTLKGKAKAVSVSADGKLVALSVNGGKRVELWDPAKDAPQVVPLDEKEVGALAVGSGGLVATCRFDAPRVEVYDSVQGRESKDLKPTGQPLGQLQFSQDGKKVLGVGIAGVVRLWDCASGKLDLDLETLGDPHSVFAAGLSPDGTLLVTSTLEGEVAVWDVAASAIRARAEAYAKMRPGRLIRFLAPSRFATCCDPGWKVIIWDYVAAK